MRSTALLAALLLASAAASAAPLTPAITGYDFNFGAYNTDMVKKDDAPKTLEDLLNPKWKGKLWVNINCDVRDGEAVSRKPLPEDAVAYNVNAMDDGQSAECLADVADRDRSHFVLPAGR